MTWCLGIDPSRKGYHAYSLIEEKKNIIVESKVKGSRALLQTIEGAKDLAEEADQSLLVGFEQFHSNLIDELYQSYPNRLYDLMPGKVKAYKAAFDTTHCKTDEMDAFACACYLQDWQEKCRLYQPPTDLVRQAKWIYSQIETLRNQRTETLERFWGLVDYAVPDLKEAASNLNCKWFYHVIIDLVGPRKCRHMGVKAFSAFAKKRGARQDVKILGPMLPLLKELEANGPTQALRLQASQLLFLTDETVVWVNQARECLKQWDLAWLLNTIHGMGPKTMLCLLAYLGEDWSETDSRKAAAYCGAAPIWIGTGTPDRESAKQLRSKGKRISQLRRSQRRGCNWHLNEAMGLFALYSMRHHPWAHRKYKTYRSRGQTHWEALRNLVTKWLRILFHMIHHQVPYDPYVHERNVKMKDPSLRPVA